MEWIPSPGSSDALNQGCTCPVLDNCEGRGQPAPWSGSGEAVYFILALGCPLHDPPEEVECD